MFFFRSKAKKKQKRASGGVVGAAEGGVGGAVEGQEEVLAAGRGDATTSADPLATKVAAEAVGELVITQPMPSMPLHFLGRRGLQALPRKLLRDLRGAVAPR